MQRRWVSMFQEGSAEQRDLLGGKGANLADMARIGLPVPPGFTVTTEACRAYLTSGGQVPLGLWDEVRSALGEVERLHQDTLDHLHILLNFDWDSRPLLSLVLVGLPELRDRLLLRRNRSLLSRIHHRLSLAPCTSADTAEYLRQRLRRVGCDKELFAPEAVTLLHETTGGTLREVDRLATWALCWAARKKRPVIDRPLMAQAVEAELSPPPAS